MVCVVSGVLFQAWDVGTLGNTLSGCVTQYPRVDTSEASAIHPTYTNVCVCVERGHTLCVGNAPINGMPHLPLLGTTAGIDRVFVSQFLPHPWGAPGQ